MDKRMTWTTRPRASGKVAPRSPDRWVGQPRARVHDRVRVATFWTEPLALAALYRRRVSKHRLDAFVVARLAKVVRRLVLPSIHGLALVCQGTGTNLGQRVALALC